MIRTRHKIKPPLVLKTFKKRKEELRDAISILDHFIDEFNKTGDVKWVKEIAGKLRTLVFYRKNGSFEHPLLIDVAKEKKIRLALYVSKLATYRAKEVEVGMRPPFGWGEKTFTLLSPEPWHEKMPIDEAMKIPYIVLKTEKYSIEDIISYVGTTEAQHYDPDGPPELNALNEVVLYGFPDAYTTLYEFAVVVSQIAHGLLDYIESH